MHGFETHSFHTMMRYYKTQPFSFPFIRIFTLYSTPFNEMLYDISIFNNISVAGFVLLKGVGMCDCDFRFKWGSKQVLLA